jgi:hypothetical protein
VDSNIVFECCFFSFLPSPEIFKKMTNKYKILIACFFVFIGLDFSFCKLLQTQEIKTFDILIVNSFLFGINFCFFFLYNNLKNRPKTSPFTYLSLSFLKITVSLIFLYPIISQETINFLPYILHFFFFYFAYLLVEIFILMKGFD